RRFAPSEKVVMVGMDLHEQRFARLVLAARIGERIWHLVFEAECLDPGDLHGGSESRREGRSGTIRSGRIAKPTRVSSGRLIRPSVRTVNRHPLSASSVYSITLPRKRARFTIALATPFVVPSTRSISSGRTATESTRVGRCGGSGKARPRS